MRSGCVRDGWRHAKRGVGFCCCRSGMHRNFRRYTCLRTNGKPVGALIETDCISHRTGESLRFFRWSLGPKLGPNYSWVVSPSLTPRVLRIFPCGLALRVRRAVRRMLPRPPVFFWLTRLSFPSRACVYFWLGSASIQDHQYVAAASANPASLVACYRRSSPAIGAIRKYKRKPTNGWQELTRLDIHASSKQSAHRRLSMMAALIVISLLTLAGAYFPTRPCMSNLRQRVRH